MTTIDPDMLKNVTGGTCPNCQQQAAAGGGEEGQAQAQAQRAEAKQSKRERIMAMIAPLINTAIQQIGGVAQASIQARAGQTQAPAGQAPTATA